MWVQYIQSKEELSKIFGEFFLQEQHIFFFVLLPRTFENSLKILVLTIIAIDNLQREIFV